MGERNEVGETALALLSLLSDLVCLTDLESVTFSSLHDKTSAIELVFLHLASSKQFLCLIVH